MPTLTMPDCSQRSVFLFLRFVHDIDVGWKGFQKRMRTIIISACVAQYWLSATMKSLIRSLSKIRAQLISSEIGKSELSFFTAASMVLIFQNRTTSQEKSASVIAKKDRTTHKLFWNDIEDKFAKELSKLDNVDYFDELRELVKGESGSSRTKASHIGVNMTLAHARRMGFCRANQGE